MLYKAYKMSTIVHKPYTLRWTVTQIYEPLASIPDAIPPFRHPGKRTTLKIPGYSFSTHNAKKWWRTAIYKFTTDSYQTQSYSLFKM